MSPGPSRFRLVIIDDNQSDIVLLREAIDDSGLPIEVIAFTSVTQAIGSLTDEQPVDLILSDINMPLMTGFDLVERLRAIPHLAKTTLVLMSSCVDLELPAAIRHRCSDVAYIRKGVTWSDYRGIVEALHRRMAMRTAMDDGIGAQQDGAVSG
jgi:CheY-like chemotaxis protein